MSMASLQEALGICEGRLSTGNDGVNVSPGNGQNDSFQRKG